MSKMSCVVIAMSLCLTFVADHGRAQELSVLGGFTSDAKSGDLSYMWQLDYRDGLAEHYAYRAAAGAVGGTMVGGSRQRQKRRQSAQAQQQTADYEAQRNNYNRAFGACMEGRGYTVK